MVHTTMNGVDGLRAHEGRLDYMHDTRAHVHSLSVAFLAQHDANMIHSCTAEGSCFSKMQNWMQSLWADLRHTFGSDRPQEYDQARTRDDRPPESVSDAQESQRDSPHRDEDQQAMEAPEQTPPQTAADMLRDTLIDNTSDTEAKNAT